MLLLLIKKNVFLLTVYTTKYISESQLLDLVDILFFNKIYLYKDFKLKLYAY